MFACLLGWSTAPSWWRGESFRLSSLFLIDPYEQFIRLSLIRNFSLLSHFKTETYAYPYAYTYAYPYVYIRIVSDAGKE